MTIFATVVTGFVTFILGQIFLRLIVEPVSDFKRHTAAIADALIEYAAPLSNLPVPEEKASDIKTQFRRLSSKLQSTFYLIPWCNHRARVRPSESRGCLNRSSHANWTLQLGL